MTNCTPFDLLHTTEEAQPAEHFNCELEEVSRILLPGGVTHRIASEPFALFAVETLDGTCATPSL